MLDAIRYRSATPRDATIMAEVIGTGFATYRDFAPPGWQPRKSPQEETEVYSRLDRSDVHARIAFHGAAAVGVTGWMPALSRPERTRIPGRAHLWILFIRPAWWGTGLAAALLDWSVSAMRDCGNDTAQLWTPRDSGRARAFYEREGWTLSGEEVFNEDLGLDVVLYERAL
jgi:GNAT superfamily N-acetyltransferase